MGADRGLMNRSAPGLTTLAIMLCAIVIPSVAFAGPSRLDERQAAIRLSSRSLNAVGVAAYCEKNIGKNPELMSAAIEWNQRNKAANERIVALILATGDLSRDEKDAIDKREFRVVQSTIKTKADCDRHRKALESGELDLETGPSTYEDYQIVQRASLTKGLRIWIVLAVEEAGTKSPAQMAFWNPDNPVTSMSECRKQLRSLEPALIKLAQQKEPIFKSAKSFRSECILSTNDPLISASK